MNELFDHIFMLRDNLNVNNIENYHEIARELIKKVEIDGAIKTFNFISCSITTDNLYLLHQRYYIEIVIDNKYVSVINFSGNLRFICRYVESPLKDIIKYGTYTNGEIYSYVYADDSESVKGANFDWLLASKYANIKSARVINEYEAGVRQYSQ